MSKITLSPSQGKAKDEIHYTIMVNKDPSDAGKFHTLIGPAGSGKTTVLQEIVRNIPEYMRIGLCAPTHKATKVLRRMAAEAGISHRVDIRTIHSALGLVMKPVRGDEVLVKEPFAEEKYYDILIIDEAGMLNDELLMYVLEAISKKVLFVGDKCQIGPIQTALKEGEVDFTPRGEDDVSRVFTDVDNISELTDIIRQAADNPIISLATKLRESQEDLYAEIPQFKQDIDASNNGIIMMNVDEWYDSVVRGFKSKQFQDDPDFVRVVCYTNAMVNEVNHRVRTMLYGEDVPEWLEDEIIVAQEMGSTWKNADEMRIISISEEYDDENMIGCWKVRLESLEDHSLHDALIVKKEDESKFNYRLSAIAERANTDKAMAGMHWKAFWGLKKKYADFKHIYAMTAHKSQGSTMDYTYVYLPDFLRFGSTMTVKRLLYTAITRSRKSSVCSQIRYH